MDGGAGVGGVGVGVVTTLVLMSFLAGFGGSTGAGVGV
jgi:hypothetical protein